MQEKKVTRGKFIEIINSKPVIGALIFVMLGLAMVFAGDVIVQEGDLDVEDDLDVSGDIQSGNKIKVYDGTRYGELGVASSGSSLWLENATGNLNALIRGYSSSGVQAYFLAGRIGIGTSSPAMKLDVDGNVTADYYFGNGSFLDMTPSYDGSSADALNAILSIESADGNIDHNTLPDFVRHRISVVYEDCSENCEESGNKEGCRDNCIEVTEERDYRDLGAMISLLTEAIKELEKENQELETRIESLEGK